MKKVAFFITLSFFTHMASEAKDRIEFLFAGQVTSVTISVFPDSAENCNNQAMQFTFKALIKTDGACEVYYEWLRNDGAADSYAPHILSVSQPGEFTVSTSWTISQANYTGWEAIKITAPNNILSEKAWFNLNCNQQQENQSPCETHPWRLTNGAQNLLQSFKNLVSGTDICIANPSLGFPSVSSSMPENCYSLSTGSGIVTYSAFYERGPGRDPTEFRVIWGSLPSYYAYYGICPPNPIIFNNVGENHVFAAKLIPSSVYQSVNHPVNYLTVQGVSILDIIAIESLDLESSNEYSASAELSYYNNQYSSAGIIVKVKLRDGREEICYLINNYDIAGTVRWKEKNFCN